MRCSDINPALFAKGASVMRSQVLREVGVRMREQRESLGYSQEEVGLACNCHWGLIDAMERGEKRPGTPLLYWLALAGADVTFILTGRSAAAPNRYIQSGEPSSIGR